jgi:hypothetical protein
MMSRKQYKNALACLVGLIIIHIPAPLMAQKRFDGVWKVNFVVDNLPECGGPPFYRHKVRISAGQISSDRETSATGVLVGRVDNSGKVTVAGKNGKDRASGTGQFSSENSGGGKWQAITRKCNGQWIAEKIN